MASIGKFIESKWTKLGGFLTLLAGLIFSAGSASQRLTNVEKRQDSLDSIKQDVAYIRGQIDSHWGGEGR